MSDAETVGGDMLPLTGVRVVEWAGLGPVPFAAMLLADMGADIVRIARPGTPPVSESAIDRGRRVVILDTREAVDRQKALDLIALADIMLEGHRPGVLERMGFDPARLREINPRLIVGRMTAWGQDGPMAQKAGHDINVLALGGFLAAVESAERPAVPLNIVADYGGGSLYLLMGVLAALLQTRTTGTGRTVDCAMSDGLASLMSLQAAMLSSGSANPDRGSNLLDGGAHFYAVYPCQDSGFIAVGAIEPKFYANLLGALDLSSDVDLAHQYDRSRWPICRQKLARKFSERSRDEWAAFFEPFDACVTPVLSLTEAFDLPHFKERRVYAPYFGTITPAIAPRMGERAVLPPPPSPANFDIILQEWSAPMTVMPVQQGTS
ncbi:alpha-methylacyl-CoA racemase [soil metagenome]